VKSLDLSLLAAGLLTLAATTQAALPPNFTDTVVTPVGSPTGLAFTPDGRLLITTQPGSLRVFQGGVLLPTPAIQFGANGAPPICANFERGLLGVVADPAFATNNFIYLYYTFNKFNTCPTNQPTNASNPVNRVSRFTLPAGNVINPASELILVDNIRSPNGNHNGGDLKFGKDGFLYISIGDGGADYAGNSGSGGNNDASRDRNVTIGKVLRITSAGNIPATNPFQGAGTARCNTGDAPAGVICQEAYTWGHRNPFRINFDPNAAGTRFFVNDVGQDLWEEIDLGNSGSDYGWNCREGAHTNNSGGPCSPTPPNMVDPIFEYHHNQQVPGTTSPAGCNSITGGAFVPNGLWPGYDGTYIFSDYVCGWIFRLSATPPYTAQDFDTNLGGSSAVALQFGPFNSTQALYYTTFAGGGQVRRITYGVGGNNPPTAVASASPLGGPLPLNITFDSSGSGDPDPGDTLTYFWDFGDGTPVTQTTNVTIQHNYTTAGIITVTLQARDQNFAFSAPVFLQVQPGNHLPVPSIIAPTPSHLFSVGELITMTGSATDFEDGTLPDSALTWEVILHHDTHTHPFFPPTNGNNLTFNAPPPEDLQAASNSHLEIRLTATDSQGLPQTISQDLNPHTVALTFATVPAGLNIIVNGTDTLVGPQTVTSWDQWVIGVNAPDQGGFVFQSWSDGGAQIHNITTPSVPTTYTATFQPVPVELQSFRVE
jgi:glucose/arabinose dehydrogenase